MSGHSKWNNIKRKKEKTDGAKAKIFTKCGREISVAVKEGGPDPASNSKLRDAIANAKANNVPNDNIERVIKKAMGEGKDTYEEILYEGYGPGGTAFWWRPCRTTATAPRPTSATILTSSAATWASRAVSPSSSPRRGSST